LTVLRRPLETVKPVSITIASSIDSIEPALGSNQGGTLVTIRGKGFYKSSHPTEVLVGGDICQVKTISDDTIICETIKDRVLPPKCFILSQ